MNTNEANSTIPGEDQVQPEQPRTSDDITNEKGHVPNSQNMGQSTSIGNEDFEEDGGAELGFGETDETEDKDRDSPLRRAPGGSTSDGTNEGDYAVGKGNSDGLISTFKKK